MFVAKSAAQALAAFGSEHHYCRCLDACTNKMHRLDNRSYRRHTTSIPLDIVCHSSGRGLQCLPYLCCFVYSANIKRSIKTIAIRTPILVFRGSTNSTSSNRCTTVLFPIRPVFFHRSNLGKASGNILSSTT